MSLKKVTYLLRPSGLYLVCTLCFTGIYMANRNSHMCSEIHHCAIQLTPHRRHLMLTTASRHHHLVLVCSYWRCEDWAETDYG